MRTALTWYSHFLPSPPRHILSILDGASQAFYCFSLLALPICLALFSRPPHLFLLLCRHWPNTPSASLGDTINVDEADENDTHGRTHTHRHVHHACLFLISSTPVLFPLVLRICREHEKAPPHTHKHQETYIYIYWKATEQEEVMRRDEQGIHPRTT